MIAYRRKEKSTSIFALAFIDDTMTVNKLNFKGYTAGKLLFKGCDATSRGRHWMVTYYFTTEFMGGYNLEGRFYPIYKSTDFNKLGLKFRHRLRYYLNRWWRAIWRMFRSAVHAWKNRARTKALHAKQCEKCDSPAKYHSFLYGILCKSCLDKARDQIPPIDKEIL